MGFAVLAEQAYKSKHVKKFHHLIPTPGARAVASKWYVAIDSAQLTLSWLLEIYGKGEVWNYCSKLYSPPKNEPEEGAGRELG